MKRQIKSFVICLIIAILALTMAACGQKANEEIDAQALVQTLLQKVTYDTQLLPNGEAAELYFADLPDGTKVTRYAGSGYYADELLLLELSRETDGADAIRAMNRHLGEFRSQFLSYIPEEVPKIDNAVTKQIGLYLFVCVTPDDQTAVDILNHANDPAYLAALPIVQETPLVEEKVEELPAIIEEVPTEEPSMQKQTVDQEPAVQEPEEEPSVEQPERYPELRSQSGTYHDYGNGVIRVDDRAYEQYGFVQTAAEQYAAMVNRTADALEGVTTVYVLPIPTAYGIVLPDDIAEELGKGTDQKTAIEQILDMMNDKVVGVNCYANLMAHRDEYLYFHTDYHWNGRGAYYAYEAFCREKGIAPYTLEDREEKQFGGFLGALYWNNSKEDPMLKANPDTVEAFLPYSSSATMEFTDEKGQTLSWSIISDVSDWRASTKYSTFAGADNPLSVFTNPEVTDGSICVVVKESYGNALLPYLVDHYSTIYEIDYRYWDGSIPAFAAEKQADDLIFANNLSMIGSNLLLGKLAEDIN